VRAALENIGQV